MVLSTLLAVAVSIERYRIDYRMGYLDGIEIIRDEERPSAAYLDGWGAGFCVATNWSPGCSSETP